MRRILRVAVLPALLLCSSCTKQRTGEDQSAPAASLNTAAAQPAPQPGGGGRTKRALLIGINEYLYAFKLSRIYGAVNDVEAMKSVLIGKFEFAPENIVTLINKQATRAAIIGAIQDLIAKSKKNDIVVLHYAGHGSRMKDVSGDEPDGLDETIVPHDSRDPGGKIFDISDD